MCKIVASFVATLRICCVIAVTIHLNLRSNAACRFQHLLWSLISSFLLYFICFFTYLFSHTQYYCYNISDCLGLHLMHFCCCVLVFIMRHVSLWNIAVCRFEHFADNLSLIWWCYWLCVFFSQSNGTVLLFWHYWEYYYMLLQWVQLMVFFKKI